MKRLLFVFLLCFFMIGCASMWQIRSNFDSEGNVEVYKQMDYPEITKEVLAFEEEINKRIKEFEI